MALQSTGFSHVGRRRRSNEDSYAIELDLGLFLVADGMGGHQGGSQASALAVQSVAEAIRASASDGVGPGDRLREAGARANLEILEAAAREADLKGMGTTLVAMLFEGKRAALAHIGDSRGYRVRKGRITQLTSDHSVAGELLRSGRIGVREARKHPHRHILTRVLGGQLDAELEVADLRPSAGDVFVLCTDGVTNLVRDEEIARRVSDAKDLDKACRVLVELANSRGGHDNSTLVVVRY